MAPDFGAVVNPEVAVPLSTNWKHSRAKIEQCSEP